MLHSIFHTMFHTTLLPSSMKDRWRRMTEKLTPPTRGQEVSDLFSQRAVLPQNIRGDLPSAVRCVGGIDMPRFLEIEQRKSRALVRLRVPVS
jgi:hypothetical protein